MKQHNQQLRMWAVTNFHSWVKQKLKKKSPIAIGLLPLHGRSLNKTLTNMHEDILRDDFIGYTIQQWSFCLTAPVVLGNCWLLSHRWHVRMSMVGLLLTPEI